MTTNSVLVNEPQHRDPWNEAMFVSQAEFAAKLQISVRTLHTWCQRGLVPKPQSLGKKRFWYRSEILAWLTQKCPRKESSSTQTTNHVQTTQVNIQATKNPIGEPL